MRKGVLFLVAMIVVVAGCAPQQPPIRTKAPPRSAQWPASKRIQRLPPARSLPPPAPTQPPKPAWVARSVVADAVEVAAQTYVVQPGDTLRRISDKTGAASEAIARSNSIPPPFVIRAGQKLAIPGGRYHRVKAGETGIAIARAYGVEWSRVVDANGLEEPYVLRDGQKLLLPSAREVAAMTMEERARAFTINIADLITGSEPAASTPATASRPSATQTEPLIAPSTFAGGFSWPLKGRILSGFGAKAGGRFNDGINIKADMGEAVRAAADGIVAYAGDGIPGFGGLILVKHGSNWVTAYAHAEALLVARGQNVKKGDVIARAGATGSVDEPQLHFEIREGRKPVDPTRYLPSAG